MKNRTPFYYTTLLWVLLHTAQAQHWTFGPKVRLPLSQNTTLTSVSTGSTELDLGGTNDNTPGQ